MRITRDEALKAWLPVIQMGVETMPECKEALDMAIKALEQEPTTKNNLGVDAISRADVDAVIERMRVKLKDGRMYILAEVVQDIIRELPSVTPQEPKTGHWIKSNIGGAKVCSVCNAHMGLSSFKFCPNCGTKMVEPQKSEDKE